MTRALRIGTRGSELALWQARRVAELLRGHTSADSEIVTVQTSGDTDPARPLWELDGAGFFTKELQAALLAGEVDLVVHSLKDLPTDPCPGLTVAAVLQRDDPRELLLARPGTLGDGGLGLRPGAVIGTSSLRRVGQALAAQPDVVIRPLRGNVPTRVRRLREGAYDGILIAAAGIDRLALDLDGLHVRRCEVQEILPAPGQGALAIEVRSGDGLVMAAVRPLHDPGVAEVTWCERAVLKGLGGGCHVPLGAFAQRRDDRIELHAALADLDAALSAATLRRAHVFGDTGPATADLALAALGRRAA